ncbi:MAG: alginate export family protein [Deltaproteobacteria bacterium]|nr:alginate export family protein [Deltaproteobacteria bacterium]
MLRTWHWVAVGIASFLVLPAYAQKKSSGRGTEAIVGTLLEDVDSLNTITSGHTRDIGTLKQKTDELADKVGPGTLEAIAPVTKDVELLKADVSELKREVAGLKALIDKGAKKLFWMTPIFQIRIRPEYQRNRIDVSSDAKDQDLYYLQRLRFGLAVEPIKGVRGVAVAQDSRLWGTENPVAGRDATVSNDNNLDLHEGYVLLYDLFTPGLEVQSGRFEMQFGEGRQIGRNNWGNVGRSFDGARIGYRMADTFRIDAFGAVIRDVPPLVVSSQPVATQIGVGGGPAATLTDMNLYGLYATVDVWKPLTGDIYGLYVHDDKTADASRIGTVGARLVAKPVAGLTIEGEAAVQFGVRDTRDPTGRVIEADHLATAYHLDASYEIPVAMSPSFGIFFDSASGDADPTDDSSVRYEPVFPTRHAKYGLMDNFSWQGIWVVGPTFRMKPHPTVGIRLDYRYFGLSTDGGTIRAFEGTTTFAPGGSKAIGHEFDITADWQAMEWLRFELGYGVFAPGAATEGATATVGGVTRVLGGDAAHFVYFQTTLGI